LKILLISTSVVPVGAGRYGGIEKNVWDLAAGLQRANKSVCIAAPKGSEPPKGVRLIETVKLPEQQDRDDIALEKYIFEDFDFAHDFSHKHELGKTGNCPACYMVWDPMVIRYDKSPYNICCLSDWQLQRWFTMYGRPARVFPKWGWVGPEYHPVKDPERKRFLFIGKLTREKGGLEAIELCRKAGVGLDVVGGLIPSDNQDYMRQLIRKEDGLNVKVWFDVMESTKIGMMQNARAILYPLQFDEAHNMVAVEASQCHTPMISYARGALPSLGITHCVKTPEEFLEAMKTVDDWFVPSKEDWSVDSRIPTYLDFYGQIMRGLRW